MTSQYSKSLLYLLLLPTVTISFTRTITSNPILQFFSPSSRKDTTLRGDAALEDALLSAISDSDTRLTNSDAILSLVTRLESTPSIPRPAVSPAVYGRWRLLHTTNANTSSPIQRKAVDASRYEIYQDIVPRTGEEYNDAATEFLVVSQVVKFGEDKRLVLDALASTSEYPLEELTERQSTGKILGLNLLGVSLVGEEAKEDPNRPDSRIDFVFDEGNFEFGSLKIPYPVPFRNPLFRDLVKGWIDITYLSDRIRISR
eukprot:CAMPEP_0172520386 /NCGR_PEP_ID=MMETSP1066-20121228/291973_1 /TAXON_ID=671091 /ORGANISM="Coscinodiscus wailesii, Strain CCMP2513" /LENGTH=257 /DNA_ID=CAMNT_0013303133 /DNA_START=115 /DNA_END=884 /DNA_ORIENTATION=-